MQRTIEKVRCQELRGRVTVESTNFQSLSGWCDGGSGRNQVVRILGRKQVMEGGMRKKKTRTDGGIRRSTVDVMHSAKEGRSFGTSTKSKRKVVNFVQGRFLVLMRSRRHGSGQERLAFD